MADELPKEHPIASESDGAELWPATRRLLSEHNLVTVDQLRTSEALLLATDSVQMPSGRADHVPHTVFLSVAVATLYATYARAQPQPHLYTRPPQEAV